MGALRFKPAVVPPDATEPTPGLSVWDVPGIRVWLPFVTADPLKATDAWWEAQREGMGSNDFAREYAVDFSVFAGKPVYPEFQDRFHLWPASKGPLRYVTTRPIVRGWDIPGPLACVWVQLVPIARAGAAKTDDPPVRLHVLAELMADCSVAEFGHQVKSVSALQFPQATQFLDFADPAAWAKQANDKVSAREELLRKCQLHLWPGPITLLDRLEPVRRWLLGLLSGAPHGDPPGKFILDWSCTRLQAALKSGYHYKELDPGTGRYKDLPQKNAFSHVADALAYAVARVDQSAPPKADPRDVEPDWAAAYLGRI